MEDFVKQRMEICRNCPIMRITEFGMKCDDRKWISPDGQQSSFLKKDGWVKGCGCYINSKAKNPNKHCVIGLW